MNRLDCYPNFEMPAQMVSQSAGSKSESSKTTPYYVQLLQTELNRRKQSRNGYSLRAFASHLGLDPSALSKVLKGVKHLSVRSSLNIVKRVEFTESEKRRFLMSVAEEKSQTICSMLDLELQPPLTLSNLRHFLSKDDPQFELKAELLQQGTN
jgi:transcriptional regulator with XRE-family HTH domain